MLGNLSKNVIRVPYLATDSSTKSELFPICETSENEKGIIINEHNKRKIIKPLNMRYFKEKDYYSYSPFLKLNLGNNRRYINNKVSTSISPSFSQFMNNDYQITPQSLKFDRKKEITQYTNKTSNSVYTFDRQKRISKDNFLSTFKSEMNILMDKINERKKFLCTDKFYNTEKCPIHNFSQPKSFKNNKNSLIEYNLFQDNTMSNSNISNRNITIKFPRLFSRYSNPDKIFQKYSDQTLNKLTCISKEKKERLKSLYRVYVGEKMFDNFLRKLGINDSSETKNDNPNLAGLLFTETARDMEESK